MKEQLQERFSELKLHLDMDISDLEDFDMGYFTAVKHEVEFLEKLLASDLTIPSVTPDKGEHVG